ncbi:GNAT family protein [Streptomyces sp. NPDC052020]|uniref:GNAT family N-acetyltransferase n=1 Tax=Streptomyces sp. NPDC052020 TaxID=3155677 RepID=UPI00342629D1
MFSGGALGIIAWRRTSAGRTPYWNVGAQPRPEARGRGIGTAAQRLLVDYLFAHSPVVRLEADTETGATSPSNDPWRRPGSPAKA